MIYLVRQTLRLVVTRRETLSQTLSRREINRKGLSFKDISTAKFLGDCFLFLQQKPKRI
jgi:hypothetical protein